MGTRHHVSPASPSNPRFAGMAVLLCALCTGMSGVHATETPDAQVARSARKVLLAEAERNGLANATIEVTIANSNRMLPQCNGELLVSPVDMRYPTRMRFAASCTREGWRREIVVRAEISADVVVAAAAIPANRAIIGTDLALERRTISTTFDVLSETASVIGHSSQRPLRTGQIVQKNWLVNPILFKRGASVRIVAKSGPVDVTVNGEAMEAGCLNDVVQVRNVASGKVIRARVVDSDTVEPVNLPMPSYSPD